MNIGIDARLLTYRRGMGGFTYNLIKELARLPAAHRYFLYVTDPIAASSMPADDRFSLRVIRPSFYPLWEQFSLPRAARRDQLDVLHCPANTGPLNLSNSIKLILTIHDVMYMMPTSVAPHSPSWYQRMGRFYRRQIVPWATQRAALINTVSQQSYCDIRIYLGELSVPVIVTHEAADSAFQPLLNSAQLTEVRAKYGLSKRIILALGGVDPRKNTKRIIGAFAQFQQQMSGIFQLAVVGIPSAAQAPYRELTRRLNVASSVVITDFVPESDLITLYNIAELFMYPSLYEGFGLPVLEAMACGTPVLTSSAGSIPEVAGDAALLVDPYSVDSIETGLRQILTDAAVAQQLQVQGLARAMLFSWHDVAKKMLQMYEDVRQ